MKNVCRLNKIFFIFAIGSISSLASSQAWATEKSPLSCIRIKMPNYTHNSDFDMSMIQLKINTDGQDDLLDNFVEDRESPNGQADCDRIASIQQSSKNRYLFSCDAEPASQAVGEWGVAKATFKVYDRQTKQIMRVGNFASTDDDSSSPSASSASGSMNSCLDAIRIQSRLGTSKEKSFYSCNTIKAFGRFESALTRITGDQEQELVEKLTDQRSRTDATNACIEAMRLQVTADHKAKATTSYIPESTVEESGTTSAN